MNMSTHIPKKWVEHNQYLKNMQSVYLNNLDRTVLQNVLNLLKNDIASNNLENLEEFLEWSCEQNHSQSLQVLLKKDDSAIIDWLVFAEYMCTTTQKNQLCSFIGHTLLPKLIHKALL
jgi:hypothetical protein